ncbi:hypothetical protein BDV06DRAFT_217808 [Aspergillus oleicola]
MRFAASMSQLINPRRPYKLKDTCYINKIPCDKIKHAFEKAEVDFQGNFGDYVYHKVKKELQSLARMALDSVVKCEKEYKNKQPVIDSERQLAGKLLDGERWITAINTVIAFCDVEKGPPIRQPKVPQKRPAIEASPSAPPAKRQEHLLPDGQVNTLSQVIKTICIRNQDNRPTICFLYLGNPCLPESKRTKNYSTPGLLSHHFVKYSVCEEQLESKLVLINHAKRVHGTVSRRPLSALGPI